MQTAIERSVAYMWDHYNEPISLSDLADCAILSRFYFSRQFRSYTGTSPGRFLAAIRIHRAKSMLLDTEFSVTDISYEVGYNSPGTFTTRFTRSVGLAPSRYRTLARRSGIAEPSARPDRHGHRGRVRGSIAVEPSTGAGVCACVGVFGSPLMEGPAIAYRVVDPAVSAEFMLEDVPAGSWFVCATATVAEVPNEQTANWSHRRSALMADSVPVTVKSGATASTRLAMHRTRLLDLPVLLALPEMDNRVSPPAPYPLSAAVSPVSAIGSSVAGAARAVGSSGLPRVPQRA